MELRVLGPMEVVGRGRLVEIEPRIGPGVSSWPAGGVGPLLMTRCDSAPEVDQAWARASELTQWGVWSYAWVRGELARATQLARRLPI